MNTTHHNSTNLALALEHNLTNLHSFWSTMPFIQQGTWFRHQHWPHKYWQAGFNTDVSANLLLTANQVLVSTHEAEIVQPEYSRSHLVTMSLILDNSAPLTFSDRVDHEKNVSQWAQACGQAFGYTIDADVIERLAHEPSNSLLSLKVDGKIAVTAILHQTQAGFGKPTTFGLHQMGALSEFRGLGLAKEMMLHLISYAKQQGATLLTLQASHAGLPLYEKLGFKTQVPLYSYRMAPSEQARSIPNQP